jgi:WD40 repeat protein
MPHPHPPQPHPRQVQFNPAIAHQVAFGCADHHAYVYDVRMLQQPLLTLSGHARAISFVRYLHAEALVSLSTDGTIRQWGWGSSLPPDTGTTTTTATAGAPADPSVLAPLRIHTGHRNEKNFVGLSINATRELIACGSETNDVHAYHARLPAPVLTRAFGNNVDPVRGHTQPHPDPALFVSAVCWKRRDPRVLLAANSSGRIKVLHVTPFA